MHGTPPLAFDVDLAADAQAYAQKLADDPDQVLVHSDRSTRPGQGENLCQYTNDDSDE